MSKDGKCGDCRADEKQCGDTCYDYKVNKCINGELICKIAEESCGDTCYDPKESVCDSEKICNKDKSIDNNKKCCPPDKHPDKCNTICTDCPVPLCVEGGQCCGEDKTCCGKNCCKKGEDCTNGICCKKGQINCNGKCCSGTCCNGTCCESKDGVTEKCVDNACCPTNKVVKKDNKDYCCIGDKKIVSNGKCVISCGSKPCNLDDQFCAETVDKNGNKQYSCANKTGCSRSDIAYDPILTVKGKNILDKDNTPVPFCKVNENGVDKFYTTKNSPGVTGVLTYNRDSYFKLNGDCTEGDCFHNITEQGKIFNKYDENNKKCSIVYDCDKLLPDFRTSRDDQKCPIKTDKGFSERCCIDNGNLTGQICPEGYFCENGQCITGYGFDKTKNNKDCSKILDTEWSINNNRQVYNTIKECRLNNASEMPISCTSGKIGTWNQNLTGQDKLICWNTKIPTICYDRPDWTNENKHFPKAWRSDNYNDGSGWQGNIADYWHQVRRKKGVQWTHHHCGSTRSCNKETNPKFSGDHVKKGCVKSGGYPKCTTKSRLDPYFNWKCP
jgi:hypothetical protein